MKWPIILCSLFLLTFQLHCQTVTNAPSNTPIYSTDFPLPPMSGDPSTWLNFIPAKYQGLMYAIIALLAIGGRIYASVKSGGSTSDVVSSLIQGHSTKATKDIETLKTVTGLPAAPVSTKPAITP